MTVEILAQWSQAGMGGAEDIVRVDLDHPDRPETFARHTPGTTLQYPVVGAGLVGWYRLPVGGNVNTTPEQATLVVDGVGDVTLPAVTWDVDWATRSARWGAAGHATFTAPRLIIHAARRDAKWFGVPVSHWGTIETTLTGRPVGIIGRAPDATWTQGRSEPAVTNGLLAYVDSQGVWAKGRLIGREAGNPYDPVISPDGKRVAWLEQQTPTIFGFIPLGLPKWAVLVADIATGTRRTLVPGRTEVQTCNPHWLDDSTLIAAQNSGPGQPWLLVTIDVTSTRVDTITRPEHGSFTAPVKL